MIYKASWQSLICGIMWAAFPLAFVLGLTIVKAPIIQGFHPLLFGSAIGFGLARLMRTITDHRYQLYFDDEKIGILYLDAHREILWNCRPSIEIYCRKSWLKGVKQLLRISSDGITLTFYLNLLTPEDQKSVVEELKQRFGLCLITNCRQGRH